MLEVQKVDAGLAPDDEVGASKATAAGSTSKGQLCASAVMSPTPGFELLQEAQGVLARMGHGWGGVEAGLEGLRILPPHQEIPEEGMHGFTLLACLAASVAGKVVMNVGR